VLFRSVHANIRYLATLPADIKSKIWLIHYTDKMPYDILQKMVLDAGFAGLAKRGESIEL
jgi:hypothetical protein